MWLDDIIVKREADQIQLAIKDKKWERDEAGEKSNSKPGIRYLPKSAGVC